MSIYIFLTIVVVIVTVVLNLILFATYKKAINQSKRHVERSQLFLDASRLKNQLYDLEKEGNFQKTPLMNNLAKNHLDKLLGFDNIVLSKIKFKNRKPSQQEEIVKEFVKSNDVELEFWRNFSSLLERLHKTNQPLSHFVFRLKKITYNCEYLEL